MSAAAEQVERSPAQRPGLGGPAFIKEPGGVVYKLAPSVPRDIGYWTMIVQGIDPLDPIGGNTALSARWLSRKLLSRSDLVLWRDV